MGTNDTSWTRASPEWHEAMDADTPLHRLQKAATCKPREVRTVNARRADCPTRLLASLARNLAIDLTLLQALAPHKKDDVRRVASSNRGLIAPGGEAGLGRGRAESLPE